MIKSTGTALTISTKNLTSSEEESRKNLKQEKIEEIKDELADVSIYLIDLCDI
ncbi:hypothetical protein MNBD_GAMMA09-1495, partial [hydrothermal vent metagenome]